MRWISLLVVLRKVPNVEILSSLTDKIISLMETYFIELFNEKKNRKSKLLDLCKQLNIIYNTRIYCCQFLISSL